MLVAVRFAHQQPTFFSRQAGDSHFPHCHVGEIHLPQRHTGEGRYLYNFLPQVIDPGSGAGMTWLVVRDEVQYVGPFVGWSEVRTQCH